jgi:hypothetical protein
LNALNKRREENLKKKEIGYVLETNQKTDKELKLATQKDENYSSAKDRTKMMMIPNN